MIKSDQKPINPKLLQVESPVPSRSRPLPFNPPPQTQIPANPALPIIAGPPRSFRKSLYYCIRRRTSPLPNKAWDPVIRLVSVPGSTRILYARQLMHNRQNLIVYHRMTGMVENLGCHKNVSVFLPCLEHQARPNRVMIVCGEGVYVCMCVRACACVKK